MAQSAGTTKLLCSICLEDFKIPKLLPCFHSFCLLCLESYVQQGGNTKGTKAKGKFDCPLCRAVTDIPVGGVSQFQTNFYISKREVDNLEYCDVCDRSNEKTATTKCLDCEEYLCNDCTWCHRKMKVSREHRYLELDSTGKESNISKIKSSRYCKQHPKEEIKMACIDCDEALCIICKLTNHENHNTKDVKAMAESMRKELSDIAIENSNHLEQIAINIEIIKNKIMDAERLQADNKNKVEKHANLYIDRIKANMVQLKDKIDQSYRKDIDQLQATLSDLQSSQRNIQQLASMTKRIEETADDAAFVSLGTQLKKQVKLVVGSDSDIESKVATEQLMFAESILHVKLGTLEDVKKGNERKKKLAKQQKEVLKAFRKKLFERFYLHRELLGKSMRETCWPQCKKNGYSSGTNKVIEYYAG